MKQNDVNWFRPLWRRVLVTGIVAAWCVWEWAFNRDQLWGLLTTALLGYAIYSFFISFPKENPTNGNDTQPPPPSEG
ncbi:hypothetical protein VE25_03915 [Devosia geojensis]|uniref:DUF3329 domain-containing protein n=1 Tax=Devosia geojensis TaxID=443610 RepID=A0A0F5FWX8_9HYPH|nr:hypothetical protein [Devosia geojensis]KKB13050.1 hypothetical protein VE25_03915 [Devosia geojensis]